MIEFALTAPGQVLLHLEELHLIDGDQGILLRFGDADAVVSEALRMREVQKTRNADLYRLASQLSGEPA